MKYKFNLDTVFRFDENIMDILNIPYIPKIDDNEELWSYVKLDRHPDYNKMRKYMVSTYGRVYNMVNRCLIRQEDSTATSKGRYKRVTLYYKGKEFRYFVHRLVMLAFIEKDDDRPFVNHIDGIPYNNYIWNLEWVNNSENMRHALNHGLKVEKLGENRSNSIWSDDDVKIICGMMEDGYKPKYIYETIGDIVSNPNITYDRIKTLYGHIRSGTHWTHISKNYNIKIKKKKK